MVFILKYRKRLVNMCFCYLTKLEAKILYPMPKFFKVMTICKVVKHDCEADLENTAALRLKNCPF